MKTIVKFISVLLAICFGVAACAASGGPSTSLSVELKDFAFAPTAYTIPASKEITLSLTNKGANEHEFVIIKAGQQVTVPFDDDDEPKVYWEAEVEPGKSDTVKFTAPDAGTYQVVCGTPGHVEQGMVGTLTVVK
jgi:uncharacterized cupredoxin-like copper-binding protein